MADVFLCDGVRTPIGRYAGALSSVRADDLAATVLSGLIKKNPKHIILIEKDYDLKKILFDIKKEFINIDIKIIFDDFLKLFLRFC